MTNTDIKSKTYTTRPLEALEILKMMITRLLMAFSGFLRKEPFCSKAATQPARGVL